MIRRGDGEVKGAVGFSGQLLRGPQHPPGPGVNNNGTLHRVTILDNDAAPTVSFTTATSSARESVASPGTVRVALSAASGLSVTVNYLISATGTTATTADYTLAAGTLTFLPGEVLKTIPLVIKTDLLVEPTETIRITLTIPTNSILGSVAAHVFSILV